MEKNLIITLEYPPQIGGIASYVYNFAKYQDPDSLVIYAPKLAGDESFDALNNWKVYRYRPLASYIWPRWLPMIFQIRKIIKREKITRIFVHQALPSGYVALLMKKIYKIPYVVYLHGSDITHALKKRAKFTKIIRGAERIIVNSKFIKNKLESAVENIPLIEIVYPCPGEHFLEAVSTERLAMLKNQLGLGGKTVFITVSRLAEGKGLPQLARSFAELLKLNSNCVWLVVGTGPKADLIRDLVTKLNISSSVRLVGAISNLDLPLYYHLADIFILLTHGDLESEEGWGTAFLEAAASGLPVIAGRVGGVEEAVQDNVTGYVVDSYNNKLVLEKMLYLADHRAEAMKLGEAGAERVRHSFTWPQQLSKTKY